MENIKNKRSTEATVLLVFLGLRAITTFVACFFTSPILLVMTALYAGAFFGVYKGEEWGPKLTIGVAIFDAILAVGMPAGPSLVGALTFDGIIGGLAYQMMQPKKG